MGGEGFLGAGVAGWDGREDFEEGFGEGEGLGGEGFEDGGEGFLLLVGGDDGGIGLTVAAQVVAVVQAADDFDGGFRLVAVEEEEGDEGVFKLRHGGAGADGVFAELLEGGGAYGEDAVEFGGGVWAVVPEVGVGVGGAEGAGVFVGDEELAGVRRRW